MGENLNRPSAHFVDHSFRTLHIGLAVAVSHNRARSRALAAERCRRVYDGSGQTYNLYIIYYLLALYALGGGTQQLWTLVPLR